MAVGEPMAAEHRSAAWAVVPMGCHVVADPSEVLEPKESLRQLPTDAHEHQWLWADDLADRQAAVPAWAYPEWALPEAQTASDKVLWTLAEHKSSPMLQTKKCSEPS